MALLYQSGAWLGVFLCRDQTDREQLGDLKETRQLYLQVLKKSKTKQYTHTYTCTHRDEHNQVTPLYHSKYHQGKVVRHLTLSIYWLLLWLNIHRIYHLSHF